MRFFACEEDLSHEPPDAPLPDAVATGTEPFLVVGAMAGGVQAAQPQLAADPGVDEPQRIGTEPGGELGAAEVRLSVTSMTAEPRASRVPGGRLAGLRSRST